MKKVSIVLPVYNGETYLRESIDSVINQTYNNWELIIVNDCSNDSSPDIMAEYASKDDRIRIINNTINLKLPNSLNKGFEYAEGEYFSWTSDDNMYLPEAIEKMAQYLDNNSNAGMVCTDLQIIDENANVIRNSHVDPKEMYLKTNCNACFMYRKDVAENIGKYNDQKRLVEDYDYWLRIIEKYEIHNIPQILYLYRQHSQNLTNTRYKDVLAQLQLLRLEKLDFLLDNLTDSDKQSMFLEMVIQDREKTAWLSEKFYPENSVPEELQWILRPHILKDLKKKIVIFGAGKDGEKALKLYGNDNVVYFVDNKCGNGKKKIAGKVVYPFSRLLEDNEKYSIVVAVGVKYVSILANQLEKHGIVEYAIFLEDKLVR